MENTGTSVSRVSVDPVSTYENCQIERGEGKKKASGKRFLDVFGHVLHSSTSRRVVPRDDVSSRHCWKGHYRVSLSIDADFLPSQASLSLSIERRGGDSWKGDNATRTGSCVEFDKRQEREATRCVSLPRTSHVETETREGRSAARSLSPSGSPASILLKRRRPR